MKTFKRILLGMDHTQTDVELLGYLKVLHPIQKPEKVYCAHVVRVLDLPNFVINRKGEFKVKPLDERLKKNLEKSVYLKLRPGQYDIQCDILEGNVARQLLRWVELKGIDLTILGRKSPATGTGVDAKRFLRKSTSSVLFVPHKKKHKIKKIVLATDFSKTSTHSLLRVLDWKKRFPGEIKLSIIHVYDIPSAVNEQLPDVPQLLKGKIRKITKEFSLYYLDQLKIPRESVDITLIENDRVNPGNYIYKEAKKLNADLLIMGAQGHSPLGSFFLGSVSEKVLKLNTDIPFLVLRPNPSELEKIDSFSIRNFKSTKFA